MKFINSAARSAMIAALVAVSGATLTASALAADPTPPAKAVSPADRKLEMEKRRQEFLKHMTDRMADRLEIKASQQAAWQAYTNALQTAFAPPAQRPAEHKTDAASIARFYADMAAEHAKRLAVIADATAKFQEVLTPDQRKTFDQMAAAFAHRHHGHHGFGGHDGRDGGWGHGDRQDEGRHWDHGDQGNHWDQGDHQHGGPGPNN